MRAWLPSVLILSQVCAYAYAEDEVEQVVVTATRSKKAVDKIAGAVAIISKKELDAQLAINEDPSAILASNVPGFAPASQKLSQFGESMRGRTPLILLDGIPQSTPLRNGARDGYFIDLSLIERIEVVAGASAIQGLGATGGIINYITRRATSQGTAHRLDAKLSSQFRSDSLDWKLGYSLAHQQGALDALVFVGRTQRGMRYDGENRKIGIYAVQGDTMDSQADDVFVKLGYDAGPQRWQFSFNRFEIAGNGDYTSVLGDRKTGLPTSSTPGAPLGQAPRNQVQSSSLDWRHADLAGGELSAQAYTQDSHASYGGGKFPVFQDASIAPKGSLLDQSELIASKKGLRAVWTRADLGLTGLELTTGLDWLNDVTRQDLALTGRTWVPPLDYVSTAPFAQLEYSYGPLTVRGGLRHERGELTVDSYRTLASYGGQLVSGGTRSFRKNIRNLGAIWRIGGGLSAYASYGEGFGLPDVGIILRGVNKPNQTVTQLTTLEPVLTENKEIGLTWRGKQGSLGLSAYDSQADFSNVVRLSPDGIGYIERLPSRIKGFEMVFDAKLGKGLASFGQYAHSNGKTALTVGAPVDLSLGARNQGPDKLVAGLDWQTGATHLRVSASKLFSRDINIGRKDARGVSLEEHFKGYTTADLSLRGQAMGGDWSLGLENLFDRQYIIYRSQADASSQGNDEYFAGRGRVLSIGWSQRF